MIITTRELLKSEYLLWYGRKIEDQKGVTFFYTASGFSFKFHGSKVIPTFESTFEAYNKRPFLTIYVKGENLNQTHVIDLEQGKKSIELVNLPYGIYEVEVRKRSESIMSKTILNELSVDGTFMQPKSTLNPLKIEWIGDSLTCGYGNLSTTVEEPFTTEFEDGLQSFASIASRLLNADFQIVAASGIGLYKSFYAQVTLPKIYDQIDINKHTSYDFSFNPDVIVINLGTNDHNYMKFLEDGSIRYEQVNFKNAYKAFIQQVFSNHLNAQILIISQGKRQQLVDKLIEEIYKEMNNKQLHYLCVSNIKSEDGMGSQYHPTILTHQRWGHEVANKIQQILKQEV